MRSLLVFGLLAACGGGDDFHEVTATVSGVVEIGDPIAGAQVFADYYDDNLVDQNAVVATTDATGHFSLVFENFGPLFPHSIVAVVAKDSLSTGTGMAVGFDLHLRAPLDVSHPTDGPSSPADDVTVSGVVITPLTTIVVSEMTNGQLDQPAAEAEVKGALSASMLPLSGAPLDVMEDYVADPSDDAKQLRLAASSFAAVLGTTISELDAAQTLVDVNEAVYFDPIDAAIVRQLTTIASGTYTFTQVFSRAQQMDVMVNPGNYTSLFLDPAMAEADIKAELEATQPDFASEIEAQLEGLLHQLEEDFVRFITGELLYLAVELLGEAL